ncbi:DUF3828 domain-containing protein [Candidatus Pantoea multigeneris]|uniref:DUF3828 domain-containing protein n=1 Tax=Candidatus Pantoea multigeneris TaxID=2608357 RepID=A0ABX0REA8_9GAMM|nr:DUF3828 domain-containing protein [Pantoea multigeneris]NIF23692.1 DUF3828 domain-containing protein [Pantoea multigeneris]
MKKLLIAALLLSPLAASAQASSPAELAALHFNQWYVGQLIARKEPLEDYANLGRYVTADTVQALKKIYQADSNDVDVPDADMFIKAQDYAADWNKINVISSDYDAACTNVYVAFGKKQDHVVADCMVQEAGNWKVRSVTLIK